MFTINGLKGVCVLGCSVALCATASAKALSIEALQSQITQEVAEQIGQEDVDIRGLRIHVASTNQHFTSLSALRAFVPLNSSASLSHIEAKKRDKRFNAVMEIQTANAEKAPQVISVSGQYDVLREVPVLRQAMFRNDTLSSDDIQYMLVSDRSIRDHHVVNVDDLVGKVLTRRIAANRPLKERDVESEQVVRKGDMIAMLYKTPSITIKTVGKASEDGAVGDVITLQNMDSEKRIRGMVTEHGDVLVNFGQSVLTKVASLN